MELEQLLQFIYEQTDFDFRQYNKSTIQRRINYRIRAEKLESMQDLALKIKRNSACLQRLQADFLIHVTEMFRDPSMFRMIREKVVPILKTYPFIRIWHAGCSTGEEVYSMAILLYEEGLYEKSRIYATDISETSLEQAKAGVFSQQKMEEYTKNYLNSGGKQDLSDYVTAKYGSVILRPFLKKKLVFAQHNLVTDHSFNEFHMIFCRNVLIYFEKHLQYQVHELLNQSLAPLGYLALGQKESLKFAPLSDCFVKIDNVNKLYRKMK